MHEAFLWPAERFEINCCCGVVQRVNVEAVRKLCRNRLGFVSERLNA